MAKRIEIRLTDNPSNNDYVAFYAVVPSEFYGSLTSFTFRTSSVILIGSTIAESASNLYDAIVSQFELYSWIQVSQLSNGVDILFLPDDTTFETVTPETSGDITINKVTVDLPDFSRDNIILSRSPYYVSIVPTDLFDSATLNMKLYRGIRTTDAPATDTYTFSKSVLQAGDVELSFNISKLINDFVKYNIPTFGTTGVLTTSSNESVWVDIELIAYYLGDSIGNSSKQYYAIDGFGWHSELYNPKLTKNVLSTIQNHIVYRGSDYPLYFVSKNLVSIKVNGVDVPFTLDENTNNQLIAYVNIGAYVGVLSSFDVVFDYGTTTETHSFIVKDVCKYPLYNIFFKNKYGFWQSIPFNLRSKKSIDVESLEYSPNTTVNGRYSTTSHQVKNINIDLMEKLTVNTDYLPESYNDIFEELLASEFIYAENNGAYLPVILDKKNWEKKTKTFDKLIQYTFDFKYSFNKINK